jgi:hypothetical protein
MAERMPGFFDIEDRLRELSAKGDDLERVKGLVDFEIIPGGVKSCGSACGSFEGRASAV